jgi:hypothetical protein
MNNNKCSANKKVTNCKLYKGRNEHLITESMTSPKQKTGKTISFNTGNKNMTDRSDRSRNKNITDRSDRSRNKNIKNSLLCSNQKKNNNFYVTPSLISNYTKSLYYHSKLYSLKRHNKTKNSSQLCQNKNQLVYTDNTKNKKIKCSNTKIENNKNDNSKGNNKSKENNQNQNDSNYLFVFNLKGIINRSVNKIQSFFKGYLIRKKFSNILKKNKNIKKGFHQLYCLLKATKRFFFKKLKINYVKANENRKKNNNKFTVNNFNINNNENDNSKKKK